MASSCGLLQPMSMKSRSPVACIQQKRPAHVRFGSNSVIAVMSAARSLFHRKRKSICNLAMSQKCHKRKSGTLFDCLPSIFRPDYPQEQTSSMRFGTSDLCQQQTLIPPELSVGHVGNVGYPRPSAQFTTPSRREHDDTTARAPPLAARGKRCYPPSGVLTKRRMQKPRRSRVYQNL
jgi:hypothetical protein